ncbi:hypothetical protein BCR43DRAFT_259736 [Syncephalastrum racemosum]|uniref:Uncharacterized protein n=1 Tax=Syncephalastrum racemosum TaxID=13706 RepID=A0A1X2HGN5_SYNRA|nr:hypothetical protein BCR43DRAFT_259736 [Syncephalastrum racemosum]
MRSLERRGIIQCGKNIKRSKDIPNALYDNLHREPDYPQFPFSDFAAYLTSVLRSDSYMSIFNMGQPGTAFDISSMNMSMQTQSTPGLRLASCTNCKCPPLILVVVSCSHFYALP